MTQPLYAHRIEGILHEVVMDLGLTLTLSDKGTDVSLMEHEAKLTHLADFLSLDLKKDSAAGVNIYTFKRAKAR